MMHKLCAVKRTLRKNEFLCCLYLDALEIGICCECDVSIIKTHFSRKASDRFIFYFLGNTFEIENKIVHPKASFKPR